MPIPIHSSLHLPCRPGSHRRRTWWCGLVLLGLGVLPLQAEVLKEQQIKAAFLYNFTKFIEWPPSRFAHNTSPIVIGVLGRNPFDDELEKIVSGRTVNGRAIQVKLISTADEVSTVQLLFVPDGEEPRLRPVVWQNSAVVVVGETARCAALGGTITFLLEADKLRFEINIAAAERSGVKISAQLQKLASAVRRQP